MAQAQHATVRLEPEELQEEVVLQRRPNTARRRQTLPVLCQHPAISMTLVTIIVGLVVLYIGGHACIARNELQRQTIERKLAKLERERVQNILTIDRLAAQPRLIQLAQQQGLVQPTADRIHTIRVAATFPRAAVAQAPRPQTRASWLKRSGRQVTVALQRLSHGPGEPTTLHE